MVETLGENSPPIAKKEKKITKIHGIELKDDYFWLRNKESEEVIDYLTKENEYTAKMLAHTKEFQNLLFEEMKGRIKETDETVPRKINNYYYYEKTEKGKNYKIRCRKLETLDADEEIILDLNLLAEGEKFFRISGIEISPDHKILAYATDTSGYETYDIYFKSLETGELLGDKLKKVGGSIEWTNDNKGVFYNELDEIHRSFAISKHVLGTAQEEDIRYTEEPDERFSVEFRKSRDKRYLFILIKGEETTEVRFIDLNNSNLEVQVFAVKKEKVEYSIDHHNGYFYFLTSENAINFKLMRTSVSSIENEKWELLIPHNPDIRLVSVTSFENYLVIRKRKNGFMGIAIRSIENGEVHDIQMQEEIFALTSEINPEYKTNIYRYGFSTPTTPKSIFDYDMKNREHKTMKVDEIKGHDSSEYVTQRKYATAKDGTSIPISIAYKKGIELDGTNPLVLYAYGSYGYPTDPGFDHLRLSLLQRNIIFAIAHIRGGGEYGKPWYHAGKMEKKMNTFTDFIACAEFLIENKYTNNDNLSIRGGSAGGLLMGAVVNLRPDLFKSVIAGCPLLM